MPTLAKYRLNSLAEIESICMKIGQDKFAAYKDTVYNLLRDMQPGNVFSVLDKVKPTNQEVLIKVVCLYMIETAGDCNVILSDDYTHIRGVVSFNAEIKGQQEYNELHKTTKSVKIKRSEYDQKRRAIHE